MNVDLTIDAEFQSLIPPLSDETQVATPAPSDGTSALAEVPSDSQVSALQPPIVPLITNEVPILLNKNRVMSFEVAFGYGSPYAEEFPTLNSLLYEQKAAVTQQVTKTVLDIAHKESGGLIVQNAFGPGGWMTYVNPAVATTIEGSAEVAERFANIASQAEGTGP